MTTVLEKNETLTTNPDIFNGYGVEVTFAQPEDFLKIKENLSRIGIASKAKKVLWQSCHILHRQGRYRIMHFKELFLLDGKKADFTADDLARRNTIVNLLAEWGLLKVSNPSDIAEPRATMGNIKVLSRKDKSEWTLQPKYAIGKTKFKRDDNPNNSTTIQSAA